MKFTAALLAAPLAALAAPILEARDGAIPGKWIITLKQGATHDAVSSKIANIMGVSNALTHSYEIGDFKGFALDTTMDSRSEIMTLISNMEDLETIEPDYKVTTQSLVTQKDATWGISRLSSKEPGATSYTYDSSAGEGTYAYVIDTGIYIEHPEFEGRATWGKSFVDGEKDTDLNGHGTHVSGTIASKTYGVAKKANLIAVKVLDADGSGQTSTIIAGMQWAINDAKTKGVGKCVANMSLGGSRLGGDSLNNAAANFTTAGVFLAVAAGNSYAPTVGFTPASEPTVCTIGATEKNDAKADFSNFGSLVDVFAPGVDILSTWNNGSTNVISGTSMATPHITGLGAYFIGLEGEKKPQALCKYIQDKALQGQVTIALSPNNDLANNGSDE